MTDITPPSDEVQAEAAAWIARLQGDNRSSADEQAFHAWIASDASHAVAFEAASSIWEITGGLPCDLRGYREKRSTVSRRAIMAGAGLVAAVGATTFWRNAQAGVYQTEVGEQKHIALADGSAIFLDTDTRLKVDLSDTSRSADLQYGRVNFQIVADPMRPFVVNAAGSKIVTDTSNLDVRRDGEHVCVVLIRGTAEVRRSGIQAKTLLSGDRFISDLDEANQLDRPNLGPLIAWQSGRAIFDNEKLSEAVAEMNRYSTVKLAVSDAGTGDLRVSGVYSVGDNAAFASSVSKLLPVKILQQDGRIAFVADAAR